MNLFHVERLRATALVRCRERLERSRKTSADPDGGPAPYFSLRTRHGLTG